MKMSEVSKIENKYKHHVVVMKDAGIKYIGDFLDSLVVAKIIVPSHVEVDFKISQKSISSLRKTDLAISISTLRKMPYVIAYYLMKYKKDLEENDTISDCKKKIGGIDDNIKKYKSIFGYKADKCLELIDKGEDLRQIVLK